MTRSTKILAATCAALALTASLAFAAGASDDAAAAPETTNAAWGCPGAQSGQMGYGRMGYGRMGYHMDGSRMGYHMGEGYAPMGYGRADGSGRTGSDATADRTTDL